MANQQQGNGRNASPPDEHTPSWRPQDEGSRTRRTMSDDDERSLRDREFGDEERRERERMGSQWDDRSGRWDDREDRSRSTEYYGQGQSGYAAGRYETDRSYGSRNQMNPNANERYPDRGGDERFSGGRGGSAWRPEDRSMRHQHPGGGGYGQGREGSGDQANYGSAGNMGAVSHGSGGHYGDQGNYRQGYDRGDQGGYLGQSGQQMGYGDRGDRGERDRGDMSGGRGVQHQGGMYGQGGYNEGMYGRGGMQNRYGSQGYQGWGQQQHGGQQRGGVGGGAQGISGQQGWNELSPGHRGKGPSGYARSDDRIREIVCEVLMDDDHIDASNIEVSVKNGEVTLSGAVEDRAQKRMAEDRIENLSCVKDVVNQLRVSSRDRNKSSSTTSSATRENGHGETQGSSDKRHRA